MSSAGPMSPFDPVDAAAWRERVAAEFEGRDPATLAHRAASPFPLEPLYSARPADPDFATPPGSPPFIRGADPAAARRRWRACARFEITDLAGDSRVAREIAREGAGPIDAVWLDGSVPAEPADTLDSIDLSRFAVALSLGPMTRAAAEQVHTRGLAGGSSFVLEGRLDPLEAWARGEVESPDMLTAEIVALARSWAHEIEHPPSSPVMLRACAVSTLAYHDAGADAVTELAYALASGAWLLGELCGGGLPLHASVAQCTFVLSTGPQMFLDLAKLRALRALWTRLQNAQGVAEPVPARIHAVTSWRALSRRDPSVNILRGAEGAWAAALGGADWITVRAFDETGTESELGRRLARNTHAILAEEARLADVVDPAGGSYAIESLTAALLESAWRGFEEIEERGGMFDEIASGRVAAHLGESWSKRERDLRNRRLPVTGVSEFPLAGERSAKIPAIPSAGSATPSPGSAPAPGSGSAPGSAHAPGSGSGSEHGTGVPALCRHRDAEAYEALRDRADRLALRAGPPLIHLVALGGHGEFGPRLEFAKNLFFAAGFDVSEGSGTSGLDPAHAVPHLRDEFGRSGAWLACICGTDTAYAKLVPPVSLALYSAGASLIVLAGSPNAERDRDSIDLHIHRGTDVVAVLDRLLRHEERAAVHGPESSGPRRPGGGGGYGSAGGGGA